MSAKPLLSAIRSHYDSIAHLYRTLWGEHIHHGYWEAEESNAEAQEKLIRRLAERAEVPHGAQVLDVGCGFGGSSRWLARNLGCFVTGITISPVQANMATQQSKTGGLDQLTRFHVVDANQVQFPNESCDVVWIIECSEHLLDKAAFFLNVGRALRPGGRLALCAWLDQKTPGRPPEQERLVQEVCHGMLCPSLGSMEDYRGWIEAAGLEVRHAEDITRNVEKTWVVCGAIAERPEMRALLAITDERTRAFVTSFSAIRKAYQTGAMAYGMLAARKP